LSEDRKSVLGIDEKTGIPEEILEKFNSETDHRLILSFFKMGIFLDQFLPIIYCFLFQAGKTRKFILIFCLTLPM